MDLRNRKKFFRSMVRDVFTTGIVEIKVRLYSSVITQWPDSLLASLGLSSLARDGVIQREFNTN